MRKTKKDYNKLEQFYKQNKSSEQRGKASEMRIDGKRIVLWFDSERVVRYSAVGRECKGKIDAKNVRTFVMDASIKLF